MVTPKYHVFLCTSCRSNGTQNGMCAKKNSPALVEKLMMEVEDRELTGDVMITNTGCFGICQHGPVMVVYPEGIWYGGLDGAAVEEICESHFENGEPVEKYRF